MLALLALPAPAAAEWHFTPMLGVTFAKSTNFRDLARGKEDSHRNFGVAISRFGEGIIAAEGIATFTPSFFRGSDPISRDLVDGNRVVALMGNVVLTTPRLWTEYSLRPFVSGGVGLLHALAEDSRAILPDVDTSLWGINVGAGAIGFLSDRTGIRFEMRYYDTLKRPEVAPLTTDLGEPARLRYFAASVGLVFRRR